MSLKLFGLFLFCWACSAQANTVRVPDQADWAIPVGSYMFTLEDPSGRLTLSDVVALSAEPGRFTHTGQQQWNEGLTRSAFWLRLDLLNIGQSPQALRLVLSSYNFEQQDAYLEVDGQWTQLASGLARPLPPLPQASRLPSVELDLPAGVQERIFIRVQSQKPMRLNPKIYSHPAYDKMESRDQLLGGILFGSFLIFGLGALMTAVFARSLSLALLGILWLVIATYEASLQGYGKYYIWPKSIIWSEVNIHFLGHLGLTLALLLCLHLGKAQRIKVPKRALQAAAALEGALTIAPFFFSLYAINQIATYSVPACSAVLVATALYMVKQKVPCHKLILLLTVFNLLHLTLWSVENEGYLSKLNNTTGLDSISVNSLTSLTALLISLAIVAGWMQHITKQRKEAADRLITWQEQEQTRLHKEIAIQTEALRKALQYADEKNREKTEILSYIGHDLRAPLAAISGYAKLLNQNGEHRSSPSVQAIERNVDYQMTLIDELLKYAKTELKPPLLAPVHVHTKTLLDDIAYNAQAFAQQRHNRLQFHVSPQLPELILLDEKRLRQTLLNLLTNACKFTQNGTVRMHVEAQQEHRDWRFRFAVTDTGVGIADSHKTAVFQAFEQVLPESGGSGLGLLIAQNIVQAMGGQLKLQSGLLQGSTFSFQILIPALNSGLIVWTPPEDLLSGSDNFPARRETIQQQADAGAPLPSHALLELALLARDGHVTDIERWLDEMPSIHPMHQRFFDEIKSALYSLDLPRIETLALAETS